MKTILGVCSIVLLLCQSGIAQESSLKKLDSDSDGKVTVKEFKDYASGKIQGFDKVEEFVAAVDADSNGEISETEFENRMQVFQKMAAAAEKAVAAGPLVVGDAASDFELQGIDGKIKLSERFGGKGKPVVVVFSRANW